MNTDLSNNIDIHSDTVSPRNNSYDTGLESNSSSTTSEILDNPVKINILNSDSISIPINNIEEEDNLVHYTDNHFVSLTNKDLERVRNNPTYSLISPHDNLNDEYNDYVSNSPVLSVLDSNRGSRSNSDDEIELTDIMDKTNIPQSTIINEHVFSSHKRPHRRYNKLKYQDVEKSITRYYTHNNNNAICSREIDILTTYVKGQKNLYVQSKIITQQKLYCLVFPAVIISAIITIISPFIECDSWNVGIISGLNAIVTLFISMTNFLKLESSVEMFSLLASLFDNIETSLQLTNSKIMIAQSDADISPLVLSKFNEVETKISDYKLTNAVLIPEEIKHLFPIISHINIFSFIQKTEMHKKGLIEQLRDIKNEIYYILYKWEKEERITRQQLQITNISHTPLSTQNKLHEKDRLSQLYNLKERTKNEIIEFQSTYNVMDTIFTREIAFAEQKHNKWWFFILCYYWNPPTNSYDYFNNVSPTLSSYFKENVINDYIIHNKND